MTEAKNFSDSYIFDLQCHVITKRGNSSERNSWYNVDDKITACVKEICLMGVYAKFQVEKHCLVKHFAFMKNVGYHYCIFSRAADDWLRTNFLGMYSYFPIIRLLNIIVVTL